MPACSYAARFLAMTMDHGDHKRRRPLAKEGGGLTFYDIYAQKVLNQCAQILGELQQSPPPFSCAPMMAMA